MLRFAILLCFCFFGFSARAAEPAPELAPLAPFVGTTWKSVSGGFPGETDFHDISKWEWAMNGQVIRITHSINDGAYGGESLIHYDADQDRIIFRYVTTDGFYTDGVITLTDAGFDAHEAIRSAKGGPTEAKSSYSIRDGNMHATAQVLTDGKWSDSSETVYAASPDSVVRFKD
ncbi:MAG: hypothetical protein EP335_00545 [Alphaproteobacteria bacterium]|nr:MAG: hypothetical protein EP335_00545 [Alphaproteobacteria bacterium]